MDKNIRERISLKNPWHFCALGFGSGLAPQMPGTFGTLAGIPLVLLSTQMPEWFYLGLTIIVCTIGFPICERTAIDMKVHDHGAIVWDEIAGIMLTFVFIPITLVNIVIGYALFRLFDIVKPWPIKLLDKNVKGGVGIMADDIAAGILACLCLHAWLQFGINL